MPASRLSKEISFELRQCRAMGGWPNGPAGIIYRLAMLAVLQTHSSKSSYYLYIYAIIQLDRKTAHMSAFLRFLYIILLPINRTLMYKLLLLYNKNHLNENRSLNNLFKSFIII